MSIVEFITVMLLWNLLVFFIYFLDKYKAKHGYRRISENTLLLTAALLGGLGALFGMYIFRHKTKHQKFIIGVPLLLLMNIVIVVLVGFHYI